MFCLQISPELPALHVIIVLFLFFFSPLARLQKNCGLAPEPQNCCEGMSEPSLRRLLSNAGEAVGTLKSLP